MIIVHLLACHNINKWPAPRPGQMLQLPFLGQLIYVSSQITKAILVNHFFNTDKNTSEDR